MVPAMTALLKTCKLCEASLPTTEFHKCAATRDGLETRCKACRRVLEQKRYTEHRDAILRQCARYYEQHRDDVLERVKAHHRKKRTEQKGAGS